MRSFLICVCFFSGLPGVVAASPFTETKLRCVGSGTAWFLGTKYSGEFEIKHQGAIAPPEVSFGEDFNDPDFVLTPFPENTLKNIHSELGVGYQLKLGNRQRFDVYYEGSVVVMDTNFIGYGVKGGWPSRNPYLNLKKVGTVYSFEINAPDYKYVKRESANAPRVYLAGKGSSNKTKHLHLTSDKVNYYCSFNLKVN